MKTIEAETISVPSDERSHSSRSPAPSRCLPHRVPSASVSAMTPHDDESLLIQRVASRDRQAFEILYNRYEVRVSRFLTRFLRQDELIEEVRNDVMLAIWQYASRFKQTARLSTWIFGIARYKALKARSRQRPRPHPYPVRDASIDWDDPEGITLREERLRTLGSALDDLPPNQRRVMTLVLHHGYSYQEVATRLGCPVNTIKTRMFYARQRLTILVQSNRSPSTV